ncbi:MAG: hypothetical protein K5649_10385 [Lachnospiraceae bacterium]|nr:hypothetical protein [Lachnospiraceae bacterium]
MARNIVYIQANDKIAQSFKETFRERNVELTVAKSAAEALAIMGKQEVGLLLVDINIPDMRLSQLVEICSRDYPTVILNVCVDVLNSLLITKLVNRHAIHKIFVAPWDVREMVEEIEESLDAAEISREQVLHEKKILQENEDFQNTLQSLKDALKKQQFSYGKIRAITDLFFEHALSLTDGRGMAQIKQIFDVYLRMQTTETVDTGDFAGVLASDFEKLTQGRSGFTLSAGSIALADGAVKVKAVNIRFLFWLIVYKTLCESMNQEAAVFDFAVSSSVTNETETEFVIKRRGSTEKKIPFLEQYLLETIHLFADSDAITQEAEETTYRMTFQLGRNAS